MSNSPVKVKRNTKNNDGSKNECKDIRARTVGGKIGNGNGLE
jgi:hypothetical protein